LRRESERKKDRRDKQRNKQTKRKKEKKKDRKKERLYFSRTKLDELLGLEERERYRRDRERENVLDFSVFQKKILDQNPENRFLVPKFERKRLKFPFPFSKLGTGKS
jgi:hypothetical protein